MRRVHGWQLVLVIAVALLSAFACDDEGGNDSEATSTGEASATDTGTDEPVEVLTVDEILRKDPGVTKREEVTWGAMFEETGALAGFGVPVKDGLTMAVQEINAAGGFQVGDTIYTIKLAEKDTRTEVPRSLDVTRELIQDDGIKIIWGPAAAGDPETTQLSQEAGVLHICACPGREVTSLTSVEEMEENAPYAFQTIAAPSKFLAPGARNTKEDYPQFTTFATICANSETGKAFCQFFTDAYEAAGFEKVGEELVPALTTDFNVYLTSLKENDPDLILNFFDAGTDQLTLLKQSWQQDVGEYYIGVELPYDLWEGLVGGKGIRDKIVSLGAAPRGHAQYTSEKARSFFEDKYKVLKDLPPAAFGALLTYDPAYMLIAAMQRAGTVDDVEKIAQALEEVHFNGVSEDDMYFDNRHIMVTGNDSCLAYQGAMTCVHNPPPPEE
ncbi:MAG: ABC transporter substrate-binding protein [Dehalococcoidia bacterium]